MNGSFSLLHKDPFKLAALLGSYLLSHSPHPDVDSIMEMMAFGALGGVEVHFFLPFYTFMEIRASAGTGFAYCTLQVYDVTRTGTVPVVAGNITVGHRFNQLSLFVKVNYLRLISDDIPLQDLSLGGGIGFRF